MDRRKPIHPISCREQFGSLLNQMGLTGTAVEVGTHMGKFAFQLMSQWNGERLYCVDPYLDYREMPRRGKRGIHYKYAVKLLSRFNKGRERVTFIKDTSQNAVERFADNSLDFVYVDGDHTQVEQDLTLWWPKVKLGGILAGHDFRSATKPGKGADRFVAPAASELARKQGIHLYLVEERGWSVNWSFYIIKEQP